MVTASDNAGCEKTTTVTCQVLLVWRGAPVFKYPTYCFHSHAGTLVRQRSRPHIQHGMHRFLLLHWPIEGHATSGHRAEFVSCKIRSNGQCNNFWHVVSLLCVLFACIHLPALASDITCQQLIGCRIQHLSFIADARDALLLPVIMPDCLSTFICAHSDSPPSPLDLIPTSDMHFWLHKFLPCTTCRSAVFFSVTPYTEAALVGNRLEANNLTIYLTEGEVAANAYSFVLLDLTTVPEVEPYASMW